MKKVSTVEFRENISECLNQAAYGNNPQVVTRRGKEIAILISVKEYLRLRLMDVD